MLFGNAINPHHSPKDSLSQPPADEIWPLRSSLSRKACVWIGSITFIFMLAMILLANWVTTEFEFVPVGFGLQATAGTYFAGFTLASRDLIQDAVGRKWVIVAILLGTLLSFAVSAPAIAYASAVAFLLSEMADFIIYTPLRERALFGGKKWAWAVFLSNLVGAVVDTVVFIGIAFGFSAVMPNLLGQMVGKTWATVVYLLIGRLVWMLARPRLLTKRSTKLR